MVVARTVRLGGLFTLAGCAPPLYVPSAAWAPLHEQAGEVRAHGSFGTAGVGAIASASPIRGALMSLNVEGEAAGDDITYGRSRRVRGAGVGAYRALGATGVLEGIVGYEAGSVTSFGRDIGSFGGDRLIERRGWMRRVYAQLDVGARKRSWFSEDLWGSSALSVRLSSAGFTDLSETSGDYTEAMPDEHFFVVEPGFLNALIVGPVRLQTGMRLALPIRRGEGVAVEPVRMDVGLSVALDRLFRPR